MLLVLENLDKSEAWAKIGHLYGKATENSIGGPESWVGQGLRESPVCVWRETVLTRLMESQIWHLPALLGEGSSKEKASASTSVRKKAILQLSSWYQAIKFFPISLWCLSSCCCYPHPTTFSLPPAQRKWVRVRECMSPLRGMLWTSADSVSLSFNPRWFLQSEVMCTSLLSTGTLGWGAWCATKTPRSSGVTSTAKILLQVFICHIWMWDQPILCLWPSGQSPCGFFISLSVGLPFSSILGSSQKWLV